MCFRGSSERVHGTLARGRTKGDHYRRALAKRPWNLPKAIPYTGFRVLAQTHCVTRPTSRPSRFLRLSTRAGSGATRLFQDVHDLTGDGAPRAVGTDGAGLRPVTGQEKTWLAHGTALLDPQTSPGFA